MVFGSLRNVLVKSQPIKFMYFKVGVHFRPSDSELFVWDRSNLGGRIFPSLPVMEKILLRILMS